jgi:serine/threonine protein kinase
MEKNLSIKSPSFIAAQRENRRRHYSISASYKFESRAGTPIRRSDIVINRLSRRNFSKTYSNSNLLFPVINNEIEKYNILSKLNIGMFGASYLIRDSNDGQMYILKRIECQLPNEFRRRLFEERRLLGCLKSNYILSLISSYMDIKHNCYSMKFEYISGITLLNLVRQIRWFEESSVAFYSAQIVLAFEYLHELNIIYVRICSSRKDFRSIILEKS